MHLASPVRYCAVNSSVNLRMGADLKGVSEFQFHFDLGIPFKPFAQLMGVLPEASKELIPMAYRVSSLSKSTEDSIDSLYLGPHV